MSATIAHADLAPFVGPADQAEQYFFNYVSPRVEGTLGVNPLNRSYSGTCMFYGKHGDNSIHHMLAANDLAKCYAGADDRLPKTGERILIDILPSCTCIRDVSLVKSMAGTDHRFLDPVAKAEGAYTIDFDAGTTGPASICEGVVPAAATVEAFPGLDLWIGKLNGPRAVLLDANTFQAFPVLPDGAAAANPALCLMGDTGNTSDQWVLYGEFLADVPANSFACVDMEILKGTRF